MAGRQWGTFKGHSGHWMSLSMKTFTSGFAPKDSGCRARCPQTVESFRS